MTDVTITDHCIVQFLARTGQIDIAALRDSLAAALEKGVSSADGLGIKDYRVKLGDGLTVAMQGCVATTCWKERSRQRTHRYREVRAND